MSERIEAADPFEVEILAFGTHPDDIDFSSAGFLIKMCRAGHRVGIVDLTRGEMGSHGNAEIRKREATRAAKLIGVKFRENLGLPDSALQFEFEGKSGAATAIRKHRPRLVLLPHWEDRHPDHMVASRLIHAGSHLASVGKFADGYPPFIVPKLIYYPGAHDVPVTFVVDVTLEYKRKMQAVRAFRSQIYEPGKRETIISNRHFLERLEIRHRYWGAKIGTRYGEPYVVRGPLPIEDPLSLWDRVRGVEQ